jgi:hypothetical protein
LQSTAFASAFRPSSELVRLLLGWVALGTHMCAHMTHMLVYSLHCLHGGATQSLLYSAQWKANSLLVLL